MTAFSIAYNQYNLLAVPYTTGDHLQAIRVYDLDKQHLQHEIFADFVTDPLASHRPLSSNYLVFIGRHFLVHISNGDKLYVHRIHQEDFTLQINPLNNVLYPENMEIILYNNYTQKTLNSLELHTVFPDTDLETKSEVNLVIPSGSLSLYDLKDFFKFQDLEARLVDGTYTDQ